MSLLEKDDPEQRDEGRLIIQRETGPYSIQDEDSWFIGMSAQRQ
jgi:hypothetical protein